ncbi:RsmB/NOP family class I SAM-dependent RNA methyltransferase [Rhodopila sp.]|uniref:RsmB/NOP family class I SAM-dependent RNA methyltransferase n=1 Tax=Rhodopila sp. TaxID=2480087 RepID=UPI003D1396AC
MADPTRESAFDLLTAVLERLRPLQEALDSLSELEPRDRAAAHRLAAAVLRRMGTLDAVLEPFLRREPPDPVRNVLRIGAAGLLLLETPAHAAVATAVSLAKRRGLAPFAGLVNAVLRKVAAAGPGVLGDLDTARLDTPAWLWAAWGKSARAIATSHQTEAPLDFSLKPGIPTPQGGVLLPTGTVRFPAGTGVACVPGFETGELWVQDAAAALPARLLAAGPGERVADLCAAPGGKTAQLAAAGAAVTAVERDPARTDRLVANLARWGLRADVINADATEWMPSQPFDAVLLDAPCSSTGTIRRHPDIARVKRPRDVQTVVQVQDHLLRNAAGMLRKGGRLIYAVCSLQPEEGASRIAASIATTGLRHDPFRADELAALPEALTSEGFLRTHPGLWRDRGGMDGFFAARLVNG